MATSLLILGIVIALAKTYWTSTVDESRLLLNETAPFERHIYQEREKQKFPYSESGSDLENKLQK